MDKNYNIIFPWMFGGVFIVLGINFFMTVPDILFKLFGVVFIVVGIYIIRARKNLNKSSQLVRESALRKAGKDGEKEVAYALSWLDKGNYIVFNDIKLQHNGTTQQFDHIVIGENGIFNIETKAYAGAIKIDEYGNWSREISGRKESLENPLSQLQRHHKVLNNILGKECPVIDILALSSRNALIEGIKNSPLNIVKVDALQYYIENFKSAQALSVEDVRKIEEMIKSKIIKGQS